MRRAVPALAALSLVVVAACSSPAVEALPPPPATRPLESTTTTAPTDYAAVPLAGVAGRTRTTVTMGPGQAQLSGTVTGPEGPVPGAVVHAERLVGDAAAAADVVTGPDGRWVLGSVLGGRYRVRAWRVPDLALLQPEVFFVAATEARVVNLAVRPFRATLAASAIAPDPPTVGQPANFAFRATQRVVDDQGTVRTAPLARVPAQLVASGQWRIVTPNPGVTDATGAVEWGVVCLAPGSQPLSVAVAGSELPLTAPSCLAPPPPPAPPTTGG